MTRKVVGVFVRFRAPLKYISKRVISIENLDNGLYKFYNNTFIIINTWRLVITRDNSNVREIQQDYVMPDYFHTKILKTIK
jgi:hypothetical protein